MNSGYYLIEIMPLIGLVIGLVGGTFAGKNLIYWKLTHTNLAGEEEELEGAYKDRQDLGNSFIAGGIAAILIGVVCILIGSIYGVDTTAEIIKKTEFLITALALLGVGIYVIMLGIAKKKQ